MNNTYTPKTTAQRCCVVREGLAFFCSNLSKKYSTALSLRPFYVLRACTRPALFSWSMELLAFASRQFAPKIVDLSARFIRSHFAQSSSL